MKRTIVKLRKRFSKDNGVALPLVALMLLVLLGLSAFAVDLGWLYLNATRAQRAADAAALGGVINMPLNFPQAETDAITIANANGFDDNAASTEVIVEGVPGQQHQLKVTVRHEVDTFFLRALGIQTQTVARTATAQFVPPLPMGSPENQYGDGPECFPTKVPGCNNYVGAIVGHELGAGLGDYYMPKCASWGNTTNCAANNAPHRDRGYLFAVDIPAGATGVRLEVLSPGLNTSHIIGDTENGWNDANHRVTWTLHEATTTPLILASTSVRCSYTYPPNDSNSTMSWRPIPRSGFPAGCQPPSVAGIYPLQVKVDCTNCQGHNRFSIRATATSGPQPRVYALGDMVMFVNSSHNTEFFFAEVLPVHAGKTLVLDLWDAGDQDQGEGAFVQILGPIGPSGVVDCYVSSTHPSGPNPPGNFLPNCDQPTRFEGSQTENCVHCYNNKMLTFRVPLPANYSCDPNVGNGCWWKVRYKYGVPGVTPADTTTWAARIEGNPIHLVPN